MVIVKHANPCGVAVAATVEEAWELALAADPVSAFGCVAILNRTVSTELGRQFRAVSPPEPAAQAAGRALSRGELDLGAETRSLALHLPATKPAALVYIQRQHPKGGSEVDRALTQLKAAGYRTGS